MKDRVLDTLIRLVDQVKAAGNRPVSLALSEDDWAEAVEDARDDGNYIVSDPAAIPPQSFMGIPVDLRDVRSNGTIEVGYEDGSTEVF